MSNSHKISRFLNRQDILQHIKDPVHLFVTFSNRQSTDGISREIHRQKLLCRPQPEVFVGRTLNNPKKKLIFSLMSFQTSFCPECGSSYRLFCFAPRAW